MKVNRISLLMFSVLFLLTAHTKMLAQSIEEKSTSLEATFPVIDKLFSNYAKQNHFPGLVYGLVVDGKLVHKGSIGYSNLSKETLADNNTAFRIASMTKSFTAMAILKLRDEGKLKLDDPVYLYIPEMKDQKYLTKDAAPATIRHLLTHGAGFPEDNPWGDRQLARTEEELTKLIKNGISFSNNPGMKYEYSNLGFTMLGLIIRKVSGQSYQNYITKNILEPLGMTHTWWEYSKVPEKELALGYRWVNGNWSEQPLLHDGIYGAMGGMITSLEDFSKYLSLHLSAWPPRDDEEKGPVMRSSIREMHFPWNLNYLSSQVKKYDGSLCPTVSAYGYGLAWAKDCEGKVFISHGGGLPGFGSNWRIMPDYGIGIISLSNLTYASAGNINAKVLETVVRLAKLQPRQLPVSPILNQRKKELTALLPDWENPEKTGIFAESFFMDYFIDSLKKEAATIYSNAGKITQIREFIPENNLRGFFILEGENSNIEISFTLTPENPPLIQEYKIRERAKRK
ncbi:MAG TPA: serine hydrolase [Prolixibacteraceae bacterium]|nr:serine hydrolase [Prolixibacteraceae bacterium]